MPIPATSFRVLALSFVLCAPLGGPWASAQSPLPEQAQDAKFRTPSNFRETQAHWDHSTHSLEMSFAEWEHDRVTVRIDTRPLPEDQAHHELWRLPVTWKRSVQEFDGQFIVLGCSDQAPQRSSWGVAGATWLTLDRRLIEVTWLPGRSLFSTPEGR